MKIAYFTDKDKKRFNEFVEKNALGSIQQSFDWGKIAAGTASWAIAVLDEEIRATALIIKKPLPFSKCWLLTPRGPISNFKDETWQTLFEEIKKIAKEENAVFLRIEPPLPKLPKLENFQKAHASYQPESTIKLDLSLSEEDLLKQMKPKGRYNIHLAEKKGVKVTKENSAEAIDFFYNLLQQTTQRDKFHAHPKVYYRDFLKILGQQNAAKLYLAKYKNEPIAGILVIFFGEEATYYYGASSNQHRNLMAPYLLQWEAIRDAKQQGCKWYDLFGIAPENDSSHPWAGVTEFKKKFGGQIFHYKKPLEYIFQPFWYSVIKVAKKLRKIL